MGVKEDFQIGERRAKLKDNESYKNKQKKLLEEEKQLENEGEKDNES